MSRRGVATLAIASAMGVLAIAAGPSAQASAYRYWTYWQSDAAAWTFASQGPATSVPVDGAVEGWRFAVTTQSGSLSDAPRTTPDFEAVCGATPVEADRKRVALIIDFGPPEIAPDGQAPPPPIESCAVVPVDASSFDVLQSVTPVRTDGGLICALGAYPADECAPILGDDEVAALQADRPESPAPAPSAEVSDSSEAAPAAQDPGSPVATIAVAALLLIAAAAGVALRRRRGRTHA